jgi:3-isopropylmalate dehydrogenase
VRAWPGADGNSPLRDKVIRGADITFVRELTGGAYFGRPRGVGGRRPNRRAVDTTEYSEGEIRRVAHVAFRVARGRRRHLTSVDKANVLATSQLWREVVTEVAAEYPEVELQHCLVDSFALQMLQEPRRFDTVVTENLMGDILTDEAAALVGTLGTLPSASGGGEGPWIYEPVHGSAPELAGKHIANPLGAIASAALLLRLTLGRTDMATRLDKAIEGVVEEGLVTPDMNGKLSTEAVAQAIVARLGASAAS